MEIEFIHYSCLLHGYYVKGLHDFLSKHKEEFFNLGVEYSKIENKNTFNVDIQNKDIKYPLMDILNTIVEQFYYVDKSWKETPPMLYFQNSKINKQFFHNHYEDSTLSATMYLDPPKEGEGGEIQFYYNEEQQPKFVPAKDIVFFFPSWIMHRPLSQRIPQPRYCINWGYPCMMRPIHKLSADKW